MCGGVVVLAPPHPDEQPGTYDGCACCGDLTVALSGEIACAHARDLD